jgi:hypothetical protein
MREADRPGNLTIEDVARLAGVSVSSARNYFPRPELFSAPLPTPASRPPSPTPATAPRQPSA